MIIRMGEDLSAWNLKLTTMASLVVKSFSSAAPAPRPLLTLAQTPEEAAAIRRSYNPNAGLTKARGLFSAAAVASYVAPDFVKMYKEGWCHPQFAYIKVAEGTAGPGAPDQYPVTAYSIPAKAARAAGWAYGPYHFYRMDMPARDQAWAYFNSLMQACGSDYSLYGSIMPVSDLEDNQSQRYKGMLWDGKVTGPALSAIIANAIFFMGEIYPLFLQTVDDQFNANLHPGARPIVTQIYSGPWFWQPIVNVLKLSDEGKQVLAKYSNRIGLSAWYTPDHKPIPTIEPKHLLEGLDNRVSQFTSTCVPPMPGLNDATNGAALDLDQYLDMGDNMSHYQYWSGLTTLLPPNPEEPPQPPPTTGRTLAQVDAALAVVEGKVASLESTREEVKKAYNK